MVAEPSVQIVADRAVGQGHRHGLRKVVRQAMDAADRLHSRPVRARRRCRQALRRCRRQQGRRESDRRHQARHRGRTDRLGRQEPAALRGEEYRQDAAGRRSMAAARRQQVRHRHHRQQNRAGNSDGRQDGADRLKVGILPAGVSRTRCGAKAPRRRSGIVSNSTPVKVPGLQRITIVLRCARDTANMVCAHFDRTLDWTIS